MVVIEVLGLGTNLDSFTSSPTPSRCSLSLYLGASQTVDSMKIIVTHSAEAVLRFPPSPCNFAIAVGVIAFLICLVFLVKDFLMVIVDFSQALKVSHISLTHNKVSAFFWLVEDGCDHC